MFKSYIQSELYERFHLLSYVTRLLLISKKYADEAHKLIKVFLKKTEETFDSQVFTANVHSFNHLAWQVKNFGPLWCTSAMMFESANYLFRTKFTGTVNHLRLIVERYLRNKADRRRLPEKDALESFRLELRREKTEEVQKDSNTSGKLFFEKFRYKTFTLRASKYENANSFISFMHNNLVSYGIVCSFYKLFGANYAVVQRLKVNSSGKPSLSSVDAVSLEVTETAEELEIDTCAIIQKLMKIRLTAKTFIVPLIEMFEHD